MADAPVPTSWTTDDDISEAGLDATEAAINFLRSPPIAMLDRNSDQNVTTSTHTAVKWNSATYDTYSGHDTVTDNERYTAVYDGVYLLTVSLPIALNSDAFKIETYFRRNDGVEYNGATVYKSSASTTAVVSSSVQMGLLTGEYVEVYIWHNRGSNVQIDASYHGGPKFCVQWIHPL